MWVLPEPLISCVVLGKLLHLWGPLGHFLYNGWMEGPPQFPTQAFYLWSLDNSLCLYSNAGTSYFLLTGKCSELQPEWVQTSAKRNVVLKRHQYLIAELQSISRTTVHTQLHAVVALLTLTHGHKANKHTRAHTGTWNVADMNQAYWEEYWPKEQKVLAIKGVL